MAIFAFCNTKNNSLYGIKKKLYAQTGIARTVSSHPYH